MVDYYEVLGVSKNASQEEIKKAYRHNVKKFHPDVDKDSNASFFFRQVQEAYDVLSDPEKRAYYDRNGNEPESSTEPGVDVDSIIREAYAQGRVDEALRQEGKNVEPKKNGLSGCGIFLFLFVFIPLIVCLLILAIHTLAPEKSTPEKTVETTASVSLDDFDSSVIDNLTSMSKEKYAESLTNDEVINSFDYDGIFIVTPKNLGFENVVFVLYHVNITRSYDDKEETYDYYMIMRCNDYNRGGNNEFEIFDEHRYCPSQKYTSTYYYGYDSVASFKDGQYMFFYDYSMYVTSYYAV